MKKQNYIGSVELIEPPEEITIESLAEYLSKCTSVVRDKEINHPEKLWNRLLVEAYDNEPSRPFEFIPCKIDRNDAIRMVKFDHTDQLFGLFHGAFYYTNMRELLNLGYDLDEVISYIDFNNYRVLKCVTPYFLYGQYSTHTQLTTVSHSNRFAKADRGYWKPKEMFQYSQVAWNIYVENVSTKKLQKNMKDAGIKRREIFARGSDMLQYRSFTIGGYLNNKNAWGWFFNQRILDTHAQKEAKEFAQLMKDVIYEKEL